MNWQHIATVYLKELKDSLRDRRTLISTVVIPTVAMPLLIFAFILVAQKVAQKTLLESSAVMVLGGLETDATVVALQSINDDVQNRALFRVVPTAENYRQLISEKKIRAAVQIPSDFGAKLAAGEPQVVTLYNYQGEPASMLATRRLQDYFDSLREKIIKARLAERGLGLELIKPFEMQRQNVAPPEKVGGNLVGGLIPYIIIFMCYMGALYPAMDLTAGEKERGTMETLLCSPVNRINLVLGKFLVVLTASVMTMVFALFSMGLSTMIGIAYFTGGGKAATAHQALAKGAGNNFMPTIDFTGLLGVFAMTIPVAILFSALLFTISLFAKSNKEAQSYVTPLIFVVLLPAMLGLLPGIELNVKTALIPILNLSLVCKEMLSGVWHWNFIALIFGSSCLYAAVTLGFAVKMFNRESVIFRV